MTGMIFFGGLVVGFLIGWIGLAFLTMSSLNNQNQGADGTDCFT